MIEEMDDTKMVQKILKTRTANVKKTLQPPFFSGSDLIKSGRYGSLQPI